MAIRICGDNTVASPAITSASDTDTGLQFGTNEVKVVNGNLDITDGNVKFASGHGIDFSADSNAVGMTGELLDDYEEGTWTPDTGGVTWTNQKGIYTKIGNLVNVNFWLQASGTSSSTGGFGVTGLPFATQDDNNVRPTGAVRFYSPQNFSGNSGLVAWLNTNDTTINFAIIDGNGITTGASPNHNVWQNGTEIHCTLTYQTEA